MSADDTPVGKIVAVNGDATVILSDGTRLQVGPDSPVHVHDVIETGPDASLEIRFDDGTIFALAPNSTMEVTKLVYDPDSESGLLIQCGKGAFEFVAGKIAHMLGLGMEVDTPAGTLGVRGTAVAGKQDPATGEWTFMLLKDPDGHLGKVAVTTDAGTVLLDEWREASQSSSDREAPGAPHVLSGDEVRSIFGDVRVLIPELGDQSSRTERQDEPRAADGSTDFASGFHATTGLLGFYDATPDSRQDAAATSPASELDAPADPISRDLYFGAGSVFDDAGLGAGTIDYGGPVGGTVVPAGYNYVYGTDGQNLFGTAGSDWFVAAGGAASVTVHGSPGDDTIDAVPQLLLDYGTSPNGIVFDVRAGTVTDGYGATDHINGSPPLIIVYGSSHNDIVDARGSSEEVSFYGDDGDDRFYGGTNGNYFDSGPGNDYFEGNLGATAGNAAQYYSTPGGIQVNLALNTASNDGYGDTDTLINVDTVVGSDHNDTIIGNPLDNTLYGRPGDDVLVGGGGIDYLNGEDGNDTLVLTDWLNGSSAFGDSGSDTLSAGNASGAGFDLAAAIATGNFTGIENIDINGSGANGLTLNAADVIALSDTGILTVLGGADDTVTSAGQGWVSGGTAVAGGETYNVYTSGAATLLVDTDIAQTIS